MNARKKCTTNNDACVCVKYSSTQSPRVVTSPLQSGQNMKPNAMLPILC